MRRLPLPVLLLALTAVAAPLWGDSPPVTTRTTAEQALTGVDFAPQRDELDRLFQGNVAALVGLANGSQEGDPGIRLRAYHSLRHFAGDPVAVAGLRDALARYGGARQDTEVLYLIAALDALGEIGDASDVARIVPLLEPSESPDLRAAAVRALGRLGTAAGCNALEVRYASESFPMVHHAIERALRQADCGH